MKFHPKATDLAAVPVVRPVDLAALRPVAPRSDFERLSSAARKGYFLNSLDAEGFKAWIKLHPFDEERMKRAELKRELKRRRKIERLLQPIGDSNAVRARALVDLMERT